MKRFPPSPIPLLIVLSIFWVSVGARMVYAQSSDFTGVASISEDVRSIQTYPFSEPNAVPILTKDTRLYPYFSFEGYSLTSEPRDWKVITLENEYIQVFVLPEVGGKVWGAIEKRTGQEFIYRNEVMKFRNIALRGPWTSGGIEFNFGVIGHTPSTATPVDYTLRENADGSVSCFVGAMDLPSRTSWRVEIRLSPGASFFETNVYWSNPTSLVQPYYNWMTAAAFARNDLTMSIPGNRFLTHPGEAKGWPFDEQARFLPRYSQNTFEGHKSYHVVGEYNDFFGGYYDEASYGFGHWSRFEDMPGQKLWLWALSREGGVWDDLLTDTDGQYVEYQAGRMLVQYAPGSHDNPISKTGFPPLSTDRWKERWYPVMGTGGITDVSDRGVMHVERRGDSIRVALNSFVSANGAVRVQSGDVESVSMPFSISPLSLWETTVYAKSGVETKVTIAELDLAFSDRPNRLALQREFELEADARSSQSLAEQHVFSGRQLANARYYAAARKLFEGVLKSEPWNRDALVETSQLDLREARYADGLSRAGRALRLDAHDADANFVAGGLYLATGAFNDARDAYSWAARSMTYRSAAYAKIAEIALREKRYDEALEFAARSLDYDRYSVSALEVQAVSQRLSGKTNSETIEQIQAVDPLNHFSRAERFLSGADFTEFSAGLKSEFPDQNVLELAIRYRDIGRQEDAVRLLRQHYDTASGPLIALWLGFLTDDTTMIEAAAKIQGGISRPFRVETLSVLDWAMSESPFWAWPYLKGLNLWALNRSSEALPLWQNLGNTPDNAAFYVARAHLAFELNGTDPETDLSRAVRAVDTNRLTHLYLIRNLQAAGQWENALGRSATAMALYPGDFNLELQHAKTLVFLDRYEEAIALLESTNVLPSENARESHQLFETAHLLRAVELFEDGLFEDASGHVERALQWPEHLGQGRPYEPDERAASYLMYRIADAQDLDGLAAQALGQFIEMDESGRFAPSVLSVDVLERLGRTEEADSLKHLRTTEGDIKSATLSSLMVNRILEMTAPEK